MNQDGPIKNRRNAVLAFLPFFKGVRCYSNMCE